MHQLPGVGRPLPAEMATDAVRIAGPPQPTFYTSVIPPRNPTIATANPAFQPVPVF